MQSLGGMCFRTSHSCLGLRSCSTSLRKTVLSASHREADRRSCPGDNARLEPPSSKTCESSIVEHRATCLTRRSVSTLLPIFHLCRSETEFRGQVRSQTEFGHEEGGGGRVTRVEV